MKVTLSTHKTKLIFILFATFLAPVLFASGFTVGRNYQNKIQKIEESKLKADFDKKIKSLEEEVGATIEDRAILEKTEKQAYQRERFGLYSPLIDGKQVEVWTYKYKSKTIVRKRINIDDYSGIEIWEYASSYSPTEGPKDFATFGGYENYANQATSVEEIKKNWEEQYITKNNTQMYYGYEYTPKSIGSVTLNSYHSYFPNFRESKPSLIQIWYSKIGGFPTSKDDPLVLEVKKQVNKIADTFIIGLSE